MCSFVPIRMSITLFIVIITAGISLLAFSRPDIQHLLVFHPYKMDNKKEWYRFITHGFIHADYMHLFVNMFVLFGFGIMVERYYAIHFGAMGKVAFIVMYLTAIIIASLSSYFKYRKYINYTSLGASGATSAVLFAFILFDPLNILRLYLVLPIPGIVFGVLYLWYSSYMSKRGGDNINHDAHFYGAVYGFFYTLLLNRQLGKAFLIQIWDGITRLIS